MARPKEEQPTAGELEVLKVLWERGPSTVREVMDVLNAVRPRAYTSVMSLLNVMTDKGLLLRSERFRSHVYEPAIPKEQTQRQIADDVLHRVFDGSASNLLLGALSVKPASAKELARIRELLDAFSRKKGTPE